jgi:hypothetical protein
MRRPAAILVVAALMVVACDRAVAPEAEGPIATPSPTPSLSSPRETVEEPPGGGLPDIPAQRLVSGDAGRVMADLCVPPDLDAGGEPPEAEPADPRIAAVEDQVAEIRGLRWLRPVVAEPIDDDEMDRRIEEAFEAQFPADLYERRTLAWRAIGAIGPQDDLHEALLAFGRGQVVGFYDPQNGELVYLADGAGELGLTEKAVLAHELVHAIDDQHFDLRRVDALVSACRDEEIAAALGVVEGSAQYFATQVLLRYPAQLDEGLLDALGDAGVPDEVPPFVAQLQLLSYTEGQAFVGEIVDEDPAAANAALEDLPPTTEQILHPERWPGDQPTPVEPLDLSAGFAPAEGWLDLDVMQIGELWLRELLRLRIDETVAAEAAAGWDGGAYRAWHRSSDDAVVVTMRTAWDSAGDAAAFADAMREWLDAGDTLAQVTPPTRSTVDVIFVQGDVAIAAVSEGGGNLDG